MEQQYLTIVQWNCRSVRANRSELERKVKLSNAHIVLLSETWLSDSTQFSISNYNIVRKDRTSCSGGVAILIHRSIKFQKIDIPESFNYFEVCGVSVPIKNKQSLNLFSVYVPPTFTVPYLPWRNLLKMAKGSIIIGGDFNAHNVAWGCARSNQAGEILLDDIDRENLIILNDGSNTMINKPNRVASPLDLTISTPDIAPCIDWQVDHDPMGSDHLPIICYLTLCRERVTNNEYLSKWDVNKADFNRYASLVDEYLPIGEEDPLVHYNAFFTIMEDAAYQAIPLKKPNMNRFKSPPWWDDNCTYMINKRKEAFIIYKNNINLINYENYKKINLEVKNFLNNKKKNSWRRFCSRLNKNTPAKDIWSQVKSLKNVGQGSNDFFVGDTIESFSNIISPPTVPLKLNIYPNEDNSHFLTNNFTKNELDFALKYKSEKAPGIDRITYGMIKKLSPKAKIELLNIYNKLFANQIFPETWKTQIVVAILKPNKNPEEGNSYRPIGLSSCLEKVFETMIKNRLEWWMESKKLLPKSQFGFRRGKSTMDNLSLLTNEIQSCFINREYLTAVFIDISKAYDNVNVSILTEKMAKLGIPNVILNCIIGLYSEREIYIKSSHGLVGPRFVYRGLTQGGILSPLLYTIYTRDLEENLNLNTRIIQYADDICIYTRSKSPSENTFALNESILKLYENLLKLELDLSVEKTKSMVFTRKYTPHNSPDIIINNVVVEFVSSYKFLGLILDTKLKWEHHVNSIIKKCEKALNILKMTNRTWWGGHPSVCLNFHKSLIQSIIDYGSFIYGNAATIYLKKIDVLQLKSLRICLGYMRSTPTVSILAEAGELPLDLRRAYLSYKFILKRFSKDEDVVISSLYNLDSILRNSNFKKSILINTFNKLMIYKECIHITPIVAEDFEFDYNSILFPIKIDKVSFKKGVGNQQQHFNDYINKHHVGARIFYTDGSKYGNETAFAFVCCNLNINEKFRLPQQASIFTAEAYALYKCLLYIKEHRVNQSVICSDSLSVITSLENFDIFNSNFILKDIVRLIFELKEYGQIVTLVWIPSHENIRGNVMADEAAKDAVNDGVKELLTIPWSDIVPLAKEECKKRWQSRWSTSVKGRYLYDIKPKVSFKPWFYRIKLPRRLITTLNRLRCGHSCTPSHLCRIGVLESPTCECGASVGDMDHIIFECPRNVEWTERLLLLLSDMNVLPINFKSLLVLLESERGLLNLFSEFLISTGLKL